MLFSFFKFIKNIFMFLIAYFHFYERFHHFKHLQTNLSTNDTLNLYKLDHPTFTVGNYELTYPLLLQRTTTTVKHTNSNSYFSLFSDYEWPALAQNRRVVNTHLLFWVKPTFFKLNTNLSETSASSVISINRLLRLLFILEIMLCDQLLLSTT